MYRTKAHDKGDVYVATCLVKVTHYRYHALGMQFIDEFPKHKGIASS